jgi:hypothetical protein
MWREIAGQLSFIKRKVEKQPPHSHYLQTVCAATNRP